MIKTATDQPAVFFATCARLLPGDVRLTIEQTLPGNLPMEREIIAAVRQAIPDVASARRCGGLHLVNPAGDRGVEE